MTIFIAIIIFLGGIMTGVILTALLSSNTDADELQAAYDEGYSKGFSDAELRCEDDGK